MHLQLCCSQFALRLSSRTACNKAAGWACTYVVSSIIIQHGLVSDKHIIIVLLKVRFNLPPL